MSAPARLAAVSSPVTALTASAYTIPTDAPEADGTLSWNDTTLIVAQAHCGNVVATGWTYGSPACATLVNGLLADQVIGRNAVDVAGASDVMVKALRNVGRHGVGGQALSAVDIALWDLKARLRHIPLHRLLGAVREAVAVYGSGGFSCYDKHQLRDQLATWTHQLGVGAVKIKIGESWGARTDRDLDRMSQARNAIGDAVALYVDANGAYGRKQAVRLMADAADLDVSARRWAVSCEPTPTRRATAWHPAGRISKSTASTEISTRSCDDRDTAGPIAIVVQPAGIRSPSGGRR